MARVVLVYPVMTNTTTGTAVKATHLVTVRGKGGDVYEFETRTAAEEFCARYNRHAKLCGFRLADVSSPKAGR